ncbi:Splicing factor U2AF 26 kDa subunit [Tritrichomonas foetus]|uniref:Splicing factor U2AF 26 kDa subunit n=1 Tax=Tritrichomonas foetus TaxID=1144522 RepID=A0A1J4KUW0_9EUKA|nr:Splicing factor U2AF 26 kDa subunit [Tritrichomonas foetus]|eukprot:OHT15081.1 Splicing factor U2AF 26 kDa subunit [Tritrichomonas foetus]
MSAQSETHQLLTKQGEKDLSICYSYEKTGSCPRGEKCHLLHLSAPMSRCLVFYHLYPNPDMFATFLKDEELQLDEDKKFDAFDAFFLDVFLELKLFGNVEDMFVAGNLSSHLQGNVYVRFQEVDAAMAAHKALEGRYYAGRVIHSAFVPVERLSSAICQDECIHGLNCSKVHPILASKNIMVQCFPRNIRTTPAVLRGFNMNTSYDSPYDILYGRSKYLPRSYNTYA